MDSFRNFIVKQRILVLTIVVFIFIGCLAALASIVSNGGQGGLSGFSNKFFSWNNPSKGKNLGYFPFITNKPHPQLTYLPKSNFSHGFPIYMGYSGQGGVVSAFLTTSSFSHDDDSLTTESESHHLGGPIPFYFGGGGFGGFFTGPFAFLFLGGGAGLGSIHHHSGGGDSDDFISFNNFDFPHTNDNNHNDNDDHKGGNSDPRITTQQTEVNAVPEPASVFLLGSGLLGLGRLRKK